jgi:hypothetical protein
MLYFQSSELGHPYTLTRKRVCLPPLVRVEGEDTRLREMGERWVGTLGIYSYIYLLCEKN